MDVAVDLVAELGFGLVMLGDLADLGRIQQPHRAPREHAAVALEIGLPGAVRHVVRQYLGDVDRRRIERFDQKRHPAGKRFDLLLLRSEEKTSELQSLMRNSSAVLCLK